VRWRLNSEDSGLLTDILESARLAISYVRGTTEERFDSDQLRQDAVAYRIGIIGEAARGLSAPTKAAIGLDWTAMMGMRNRLFHGYRDTNLVTLWKTVKIDLPEVVSLIEAFLDR
jgi:uncharacterized protein with HEPN domain